MPKTRVEAIVKRTMEADDYVFKDSRRHWHHLILKLPPQRRLLFFYPFTL
jgi:hypothetical protein